MKIKALLSIKPEFANKILSGEKLFEFRKVIFTNPSVKTVIIYATMPVGKVIGEFEIDEIIAKTPSELWEMTSQFSGITESFFMDYFKGRRISYAIKVKKAERYKEPLDLALFLPHGHPPQSFCYIRCQS